MSLRTRCGIPVLVVAAATVVTAVFAPSSQAQGLPLDCAQIASLGNDPSGNALVRAQLNDSVAGQSVPSGPFSRLTVEGVSTVSFSGCDTKIDMTIKESRLWPRRDAEGTATVTGVTSVSIESGTENEPSLRFCLNNPEVADVELSHTFAFREAIYKAVANLVAPVEICKTVPIPQA